MHSLLEHRRYTILLLLLFAIVQKLCPLLNSDVWYVDKEVNYYSTIVSAAIRKPILNKFVYNRFTM